MVKSLRVAFGETLAQLGAENDKIVALDADLANATQSKFFRDAFPERFFDMGIAEANMVDTAAGLAHDGFIPFVSTFALFGTGRAYEQIRNSVAYENLNVKFALSHSGLSVGEDGGSHQSVEDIALMRVMPNMNVIVPADPKETEKAIRAAVEIDGPVYVRVGRPVVEDVPELDDKPFEFGKATIVKDGSDAAIIACGLMLTRALEAAKQLEAEGISTAVINMHTIKPIDADTILKYNDKVKAMVTMEEHSIIGGLGSAVAEVLAGHAGAKFSRIGINDVFGQSGTPDSLFEEYGLTAEHAVTDIKNLLSK